MSRPPLAPLLPPSIPQVLARALRLLCPRCGRTPLFAGWFRMYPACAVCGLRYEREPGYFVGAIYVNYTVTAACAVGGVLLADWAVGLSLAAQLTLGVTLCLLVPVVFFRYSRSLWLAVAYLVTRAGESREAQRLQGK